MHNIHGIHEILGGGGGSHERSPGRSPTISSFVPRDFSPALQSPQRPLLDDFRTRAASALRLRVTQPKRALLRDSPVPVKPPSPPTISPKIASTKIVKVLECPCASGSPLSSRQRKEITSRCALPNSQPPN